jgi:hypothetical protein
MARVAMAKVPVADKVGVAAKLSRIAMAESFFAEKATDSAFLAVVAVTTAHAAGAWTIEAETILSKCETYVKKQIKYLKKVNY